MRQTNAISLIPVTSVVESEQLSAPLHRVPGSCLHTRRGMREGPTYLPGSGATLTLISRLLYLVGYPTLRVCQYEDVGNIVIEIDKSQ